MFDDLFEADHYTSTRLPCDKYSIIWTVDQFPRFLKANYKLVESSAFQPLGPDAHSFKLVCQREPSSLNFSIQLVVDELKNSEVNYFTVRLFLLDRSEEHDHRISREFHISVDELNKIDKVSNVLLTFEIENEEGFYHNEEVATIRCEMVFYSDPLTYAVTTKIEGYRHYSQLIDDLHQIYETQEFSDGVICVRDHEFFISRAVLAARSPVFKAMFTCGLSESQGGRVTIEDFSPEVLKHLLEYIYTGRIGGRIEEIGFDLLEAGNKYCIEGVKNLAQESLVKSISTENVCEHLIHADMYEAKLLKQQCISYIALNRNKVVKTNGWKLLADVEYHSLMLELIETTKDLQI
ncbi:Speckle-type POZ protein-like isoform X2 [Aphelenchoides besseyi]|nr:Speckle-type POZ protein-like isoform X2 [Aphelenchoides besseyi]